MSISQNYSSLQPSLNINFAKSKKIDPRITFIRASTATRTNSSGLIQTVSSGYPRFDHSYSSSTGTTTSLGLLIEETRTNLITYSEDITDTSWNKANITVSSNVSATSAPDGSNNADKFIETTAANSSHILYKSRTATNETLTFSVFCKAAERTKILLQFSNFVTADVSAIYDLSTGTTSSLNVNALDYSNASVSMIPYPNGWYRCIMTATKGSANTTNNPSISLLNASATGVYTGDGTSGVYVWGAQVESGGFPTSYIPTTTATATRTGDLAYIDLPSNNWYNSLEGTLVFQHSTMPFATGTTAGYPAVGFAQTSGASTDAIQYFFVKSNGNTQYLVRTSNVNQATIPGGNLSGGNQAARVGFLYKASNFVLVRSGTEIGTGSSGTIPTVGSFLLGNNQKDATLTLNAHITNLAYYPRVLTSTLLQTMTR